MKPILTLSVLSFLSMTGAVLAQDAAPEAAPEVAIEAPPTEAPQPQAEVDLPVLAETFGKWEIYCVENGGCFTSKRDVLTGESEEIERGIRLTISFTEQGAPYLTFATDLPVILPAGVTISRDESVVGAPFWKQDYQVCTPGGCVAEGLVDLEILKAYPDALVGLTMSDGRALDVTGEFNGDFVKAIDMVLERNAADRAVSEETQDAQE